MRAEILKKILENSLNNILEKLEKNEEKVKLEISYCCKMIKDINELTANSNTHENEETHKKEENNNVSEKPNRLASFDNKFITSKLNIKSNQKIKNNDKFKDNINIKSYIKQRQEIDERKSILLDNEHQNRLIKNSSTKKVKNLNENIKSAGKTLNKNSSQQFLQTKKIMKIEESKSSRNAPLRIKKSSSVTKFDHSKPNEISESMKIIDEKKYKEEISNFKNILIDNEDEEFKKEICIINMNIDQDKKENLIEKKNGNDIENIKQENNIQQLQINFIESNFAIYADKISSFLHSKDLLCLSLINKNSFNFFINKLKDNIESETKFFELKIKQISEKYPEYEICKEIPNFVLTRGTIKAIELLNEGLYPKVFNSDSFNPDIILPYKIYLQFLNKIKISGQTNEYIWKNLCQIFREKSNGKIGDFINKSVKDFDLSSENIFQIYRLCENKEKKINPTFYSKICGTTGLIVFLIRDVLEFLGVIVDKKTLPASLYKLYKFNYEKDSEILEKLKKIHVKNIVEA